METELRCPLCSDFFRDDARLLNCGHSLCLRCAENLVSCNEGDSPEQISVRGSDTDLSVCMSSPEGIYNQDTLRHSQTNQPTNHRLIRSSTMNQTSPQGTAPADSLNGCVPRSQTSNEFMRLSRGSFDLSLPGSTVTLCNLRNNGNVVDDEIKRYSCVAGQNDFKRQSCISTSSWQTDESRSDPRHSYISSLSSLSLTSEVDRRSRRLGSLSSSSVCAGGSQMFDCLSLSSETDSGLGEKCYRPSETSRKYQKIKCPTCSESTSVDPELGPKSLIKNLILSRITRKYLSKQNGEGCSGGVSRGHVGCDGCKNNIALLYCSDCTLYYCDECSVMRHSGEGATHTVQAIGDLATECMNVSNEFSTGALSEVALIKKSEMRDVAKCLSEKTRRYSLYLNDLKSLHQEIQNQCLEAESVIVAQCDALIGHIEQRKQQLVDLLLAERDRREESLTNQSKSGQAYIHRTTGLLQYCVEVLGDKDTVQFTKVCDPLLQRLSLADEQMTNNQSEKACVDTRFDVKLDLTSVLQAVDSLSFIPTSPPEAPRLISAECDGNVLTVSWHAIGQNALPDHTHNLMIDVYSLELCEGNVADNFVEVWKGVEIDCVLEGLHFDSEYSVRVRSRNVSGYSSYSNVLSTTTNKYSRFNLRSSVLESADHSWVLTRDWLTVSSRDAEDHVLLASTGLSRGVHYWEFCIDCYTGDKDPAFGIARHDTDRNQLLGKDSRSWSMYMDGGRSWFVHADKHTQRCDVGITTGSVIGLFLDLDLHTLTFYLNGRPVGRGGPAFSNLHGVFYPAVSLNHCTTVTLKSGLRPPDYCFLD